jgi:hypothetical protein
MKLIFLFFASVLLILGNSVFAEDASNIQNYTEKAKVYIAQSERSLPLSERKMEANALYSMVYDKQNFEKLSNVLKLLLAASACEQHSRYLESIPHTKSKVSGFADSPDCTNVIVLLDMSLDILNQITTPTNFAVGNIMPPITTSGGPMASGMDPEAIQDVDARNEYKRRRAQSVQATELKQSHRRLKLAIEKLTSDIKNIVIYLKDEKKQNFMTNAIEVSNLPPEVKRKLLEK